MLRLPWLGADEPCPVCLAIRLYFVVRFSWSCSSSSLPQADVIVEVSGQRRGSVLESSTCHVAQVLRFSVYQVENTRAVNSLLQLYCTQYSCTPLAHVVMYSGRYCTINNGAKSRVLCVLEFLPDHGW